MAKLFSQVLNMSMTASVVIIFVLIARFLLKKFPKIYSYLLWSVVLFRLLCPFSINAPVSVLNAVQPESREVTEIVSAVSYLPDTTEASTDYFMEPVTSDPGASVSVMNEGNRVFTPMHLASLVWTAGVGILILYSAIQYISLRVKLIGSRRYRYGVYLTDHLETAFVLGLIRPKIYIPAYVPQHDRTYILAHEHHHIRRGDHIVKLVAFAALCLHWFNPLVWIAFVLSGKDMEMSCDEAVIRKMGPQIRGDYSAALLRLTAHRQIIPGMPLAFGEGDTKKRVKNMAKWKRPKVWVSILCLTLCLVVIGIAVLNPEKEESQSLGDMTRVQGPASIGVDDLDFSIPKGFSFEVQENEDFNVRDPARYIRVMRKNGIIAGGVNVLQYPQKDSNTPLRSTWDWVEALHIPENVPQERLMISVEGNAFAPSETKNTSYTACASYGNHGVEETVHYLFEGEAYVYDLWFDMWVVTEKEKVDILNSLKGEFSLDTVPYELSFPFAVLPEGYSYRMESVHHGRINTDENTVGEITVYDIPDGFARQEYMSRDFLAMLGIPEAADDTLGCFMDNSGGGWKAEFFRDVPNPEERPYLSWHQFYATRDGYIIDIWMDMQNVDDTVFYEIMRNLDIPEIKRMGIPDRTQSTGAGAEIPTLSFEIQQLPEGVTYDILGDNCVLFISGRFVVGGVDVFPIPDGMYDPNDKGWFWLERMGLADFEDDTLRYTGGMTSGDTGWIAEFESDVTDPVFKTVHNRHVYRVVGDQLFDIWTDMMILTPEEANAVSGAVRIAQIKEEVSTPIEKTEEEIAFEKTAAIMAAVSDGSSHIVSRLENTGNEGPRGYERTFLFHEGNYLFTNQVLAEGDNITEAGEYHNRYAMMIVEDEFFSNEGYQGEPGDIRWVKAEPSDPMAPWLGNHIWVKSYVSYIGTMPVDTGICYMFRYDAPYEDKPEYDGHYFVNFYFDSEGVFQYIDLQVNLFRENEFSVRETILSLDPDVVSAQIDREYNRAIS